MSSPPSRRNSRLPQRTSGPTGGPAGGPTHGLPLGGLRGGTGGNGTPYRYYTQLPPRDFDGSGLLVSLLFRHIVLGLAPDSGSKPSLPPEQVRCTVR